MNKINHEQAMIKFNKMIVNKIRIIRCKISDKYHEQNEQKIMSKIMQKLTITYEPN